MNQDDHAITGPVFDAIDAILRESPVYRAFRAGNADRAAFMALVDESAVQLVASGLPVNDVPFIKRFPPSPMACALEALADLKSLGAIASTTFDDQLADDWRRMAAAYDHGSRFTYIYPEEGLMLAGLARACLPRHAIFLGSYYGYWAHWALPVIAAAGGRAILVDPDEDCCVLARRNARRAGVRGCVEVVADHGEALLASKDEFYDFIVIDAENPRDHPEPEQRGKRVYQSLLRAVLPRATPDAMLICHNILFSDTSGDPAFSAIIARNHAELDCFTALARRHFDFVEYHTTEGVGVGRRLAGSRI